MRNERHNWTMSLALLLFLVALIAGAPAVYAEDEITIDVAGDMEPGGTVTATLVVNDGSTFQSATWTQVEGVEAVLSGTDTQMLTAVLGDEAAYKDELFLHLMEPPITEDQLPPNVELPDGEFPGGLPARWGVVGVNPHAVEVTAIVVFDVTVVTSSGTYELEAEVHTHIPWKSAAGIENVATGGGCIDERCDADGLRLGADGSQRFCRNPDGCDLAAPGVHS